MPKEIKSMIRWYMPDTNQMVTDTYILEVPKGISPSFYLWISTGMKYSFKTKCLADRLMGKKSILFKK